MLDDELSGGGCLLAKEALVQVRELGLSVRALERKGERDDSDRIRLGERVSGLDERLTSHEAASNNAVHKLDVTLSDLKEAVGDVKNLVNATIPGAVVGTDVTFGSTLGSGVAMAWRQTPRGSKAKIVAGVLALLMTPEVLKAAGRLLLMILAHYGGK